MPVSLFLARIAILAPLPVPGMPPRAISPAEARATASVPAPKGAVLVAGMAAREVWLVDVVSGERLASFDTHADPHEVAVSTDLRRAAVTNYGGAAAAGNQIQVVELPVGRVVRTLEVEGEERLHGVAFLPGDSLLAVTSERTGEVLVLGIDEGTVRRRLPTGGRASHMLAVAGPWVFTANIVDGTVSRMALDGSGEPRVWPAGTGTEGIAAAPDGGLVVTASMEGGTVVGLDGDSGSLRFETGGLRVPYRLAVTADGRRIVVTDPEAREVVVLDASGEVEARIDIGEAARAEGLDGPVSPQGFVLSPDGGRAFVSTKGIDRVAVVDLDRARVERFLPAPTGPDGVAFVPAAAWTAGSGGAR